MIINTAGDYTLQYTATDACGNTTVVERELTVEEPPTYRTVLYTDGTFIINESSWDEDSNVQAHGEPIGVYNPFEPNGNTNVKKYIFSGSNVVPWYVRSQNTQITNVQIGSPIQPTSTAYWFYELTNAISFDFSNLDTSHVTNMRNMFYKCTSVSTLNVGGFDTKEVTIMAGMFQYCQSLTSLDLSNFDTRNVTNMESMLANCDALTSVDMSSFDTSNVTNMQYVFNYCRVLATIYASASFATDQATDSFYMFGNMSTSLVGGAGTVWNSSYTNKARAHIDGGTANPGYFTAKP